MGVNGETYTTMVSNSAKKGESVENNTQGAVAGITMDIEGVIMLADFEVIEIVDDSNPYPAYIGIDWDTDMNGVINLKKHKMIFEKKSLCIIIPLDPIKGSFYDDFNYIYKITAWE